MTPDRITVSVIQHRLEAIVQEMGEAMLRTAYSQILNSSRDFSTAMFDGRGRLAAQAEHVPIHVGALPWAVQSVAEYFAGRIRPGDLFLLNDPYHGNNHLPDLTVLLPVFWEGQLVFWSINRAHQHDIGGATHGTYNPGATEIWQEGLRVPPIRLSEAGRLRQDLLDLLALNVRNPREFRGDLAAMLGAAHLGERRVSKLFSEFGAPIVEAAIEAILDATEQQTRTVVSTWQDGVFHGEAFLDDDGHGRSDIRIAAKVTKQERHRGRSLGLRSAVHQFRQFLPCQYAGGGGDGFCLSDRRRNRKKHRCAAAIESDRKAGDHRLGRSRPSGDLVHQPSLQ